MLKSGRILALDIGSSGIKLAEFSALRSGGIELMKFGVASLGLDPQNDADRPAFITATIKELLQEHQIKPGPVLLSVSGQSVFSRFVKLPPVDKEKVYQIILYEAQQNVPFPIDEVVWDYQLLSGTTEGEVDVMLAAIKAEIIEELTDAVESTGLVSDLVDVAPMTLYNCVRYNYDELQGCILVVDIGARSTDLIFMEAGRVFIRSVPVAGNAITQQIMREFELNFADAEEMKQAHAFVSFGPAYEAPKSEVADKVSKSVRTVMTRMHAEINRSINFYRSQQSGSAPSIILLTGGTSVIPHTDTFFKEKLHVEVDYLNPFLNVAVSETISSDDIGRYAHELGEVVGLGLRRVLTCPIEINLMPPKVVEEKAFRKKVPLLLTAMAGLVLIAGVWCAYFLKLSKLTGEELDKVSQRVGELEQVEAQLRPIEAETAEIEKKIETLMGRVGERSRWLELLGDIHACLPDGMWLTSISPVPTAPAAAAPAGPPGAVPAVAPGSIEQIRLTGLGYIDRVPSTMPIVEFRDRLRQSKFFAEGTDIQWSPTPGADDVVRQFEILVVLKEPIAP
jgi:type IV pilus assembly protein PilM